MNDVYLVVVVITAAVNLFAAVVDWVPLQRVVDNATRLHLPVSLLPTLGVLKAAGAVGLLVGLAIPLIGIAAATGLVLFFLMAIGAHLRARDYRLSWAGGYLVLAIATLSLGLAT